MMHVKAIVSFVIVLCLCAPVLAAGYNDAVNGDWDDAGTWNPSTAVPGSGDTATLDSNQVTVNLNLTGAAAPDEIILDGGTMYGSTGGTYDVDSPITVNSASDVYVSEYRSLEWNGAISDGATTTGAITVYKNQDNYREYMLRLYAASPSFSGGWVCESNGVELRADGALGTGTVTCNEDGVRILADQSGTIKPALVIMNAGDLRTENQKTVTDWDIQLNDGSRLYGVANSQSWTRWTGGTCQVSGNVTFYSESGGGGRLEYNGDVSGDGTISIERSANGGPVYLGGDNSGFTGAFNVTAGNTLRANSATALGSATVYLAGTLEPAVLDAGYVVVQGGQITNLNTNKTIGSGATIELTAAGGGFFVDGQNRTLTVDAKVTGAGGLVAAGVAYTAGPGTYVDKIKLTNAANDYAAGTSLDFGYGRGPKCRGELVVAVNGALGGGTLTVNQSRVVTEPASVNDAVLTSVSAVEVRGGTLELNSTENDGKIHLYEGGALINAAGSTTISYGAGGNVHVHDGAIIHPDLALPTAGEIEGGGQVYRGLPSAASGTYTVGGVVKGVATVDNWPTLDGTVTDTDGAGISLYVQDLRYMTLNGPTLQTAGPINLEGGGRVEDYSPDYTGFGITGDAFAAMTGAKVMNMNADGRLYLNSSAAVPAGATLNVNAGLLLVGAADTFAAGAQVDLNYGGGLYLDQDISSGTVTANSGSGIYINSATRLSGGAEINWNGGGLVMPFKTWSSGVPANANYLLAYEAYNQGLIVTGDFSLTDETRMTAAASYRESRNYVAIEASSGDITTTGSVARIANDPELDAMQIKNKINIPGKTLIIGDNAGTFRSMRWDGLGFEDIGQDGTVILRNEANDNDIGSVWVQSGTLYPYSGLSVMGQLGNADELRVDAGAKFYMRYGYTSTDALSLTVSGEGTLEAPNSVYIQAIRVGGAAGPHAGTLSPGASVGIIHIASDLGFRSTNYGVDDDEYAHLLIDVAGSGGMPGTDHDQVLVTGRLGDTEGAAYLQNAELKLAVALPSGLMNPDDLALVDMDILDGGTLLAGSTHEFHSVALTDDTDSHWTLDDTTALTYDSGAGKIILHGSAITWTGQGGDATLDDKVTYIDLGILATNYGGTGKNWSDADFTFDGAVTYLDLGILATNYGWEAGGAAGAVPEPASAALILVGASLVSLLRRKRR